jgi:hypothetical protein
MKADDRLDASERGRRWDLVAEPAERRYALARGQLAVATQAPLQPRPIARHRRSATVERRHRQVRDNRQRDQSTHPGNRRMYLDTGVPPGDQLVETGERRESKTVGAEQLSHGDATRAAARQLVRAAGRHREPSRPPRLHMGG